MQKKRAIIIGSGIGGIALSIRLAVKGFDVEVYEKNSYPGGKLTEINLGPYRFDAGPSLFTMPQYVDELFELTGTKPKENFKYTKLMEVCNYFYEDGTKLNIVDDHKINDELFSAVLGEKPGSFLKFLKNSELIYKITNHVFLQKSLHQITTYLDKGTILSFINIGRIGIFKSMNKANTAFFKNPKSVQFFNRYATYNGSNPFEAPSTLNIIPHFEFGFGAFFPEGGMISITNALVSLAQKHGVNFIYNAPVEKILIENNVAKGIVIKGEKILCEAVISNQDVTNTYRYLLNKTASNLPVFKNEPSSSAIIFYWGIKREFKELGLHNILFSENYENEFEEIFINKSVGNDPTLYINITSKLNKTDAPEGCENWFVMVNVPHNSGQNWDKLIAQTKASVTAKINRILKTDIESYITVESILDPVSIESKTGSFAGALYGSSSNKKMAAFFRHSNFSKTYKGLYFTGGSVHPGGGIPLCLLSAKITSDLIK
jgi:phytoene desaturase